MAVHRVLIERDQQIDPVAHVGHFVGTGANGEKCMAAANDRLVRVVGVQVQPAPAEDLCEDIARRGYTLTGRATDTDGEGLTHRFSPGCGAPGNLLPERSAGSHPVKAKQDSFDDAILNATSIHPASQVWQHRTHEGPEPAGNYERCRLFVLFDFEPVLPSVTVSKMVPFPTRSPA